MSEGELLQMEKSRSLNLKEDIYFEIIRNKTASLLHLPALPAPGRPAMTKTITEKMRLFGEKIGMAFQIKDDLFDYASDNVGKPPAMISKKKN